MKENRPQCACVRMCFGSSGKDGGTRVQLFADYIQPRLQELRRLSFSHPDVGISASGGSTREWRWKCGFAKSLARLARDSGSFHGRSLLAGLGDAVLRETDLAASGSGAQGISCLSKEEVQDIAGFTANGVVLATEKKQKSILYDERSVHKVEPITKHIGLVYSGMGPDYRVLVHRARKLAQQYYLVYQEPIPTAQLVQRVASVMQEYTQSGQR
ncbi:hypothetical protein P7K49_024952 [Saguinus oedipus]|uniref:Proteasome subunit alpha type-2 n=1 Tax=Saguinus oedipus TaxID=9490 RepID=A0ABQ9UH70_SAGOE|nr:hypothetical protein P7K49_024952 [Saguinus oedipus]